MKLIPTTNRILGRPVEPEHITEGGIHLPTNRSTYTMTTGDALEIEVLAVGPHVHDVKPGMTIWCDPNACEDVTFELDGETYVSVPEEMFDWKNNDGFLLGICKEADDGSEA